MKKQTISKKTTIKEAMVALNKNDIKCLLVIDDQKKLLGTVTDGDIRRGILNGLRLKSHVVKCANTSPITIDEKHKIKNVNEFLKENEIKILPIINNKGKLIDFISYESTKIKIQKEKLKNVNTVIMAGGKGKRLEPFTSILPKPLIPIRNKPIIEHIIERFYESGSSNFFISTNYKASIIKAYFNDKKISYKINFINEEHPLGTAGSLKYIENKFTSPFFLTNCDVIAELNYHDLYNFHLKKQYEMTIVASLGEFTIPYGILNLNKKGELRKIEEKPSSSHLVNTGIYVLSPNVIELIPKKKYFDMTDLIKAINSNKGSIGVYPIHEDEWSDVGQWDEFQKTERKFSVK